MSDSEMSDSKITPRAAAEKCPKCNQEHTWSTDDYDQNRGCDDCETVWHSCASGNLSAPGYQDKCSICSKST